MKRTLVMVSVVVGIGVMAGIAFQMSREDVKPVESTPAEETSAIEQTAPAPIARHVTAKPRRIETPVPVEDRAQTSAQSSELSVDAVQPAVYTDALFKQAVDCIASPTADFGQKESAFRQLRESGKLDQAITDLEQRMAKDSTSASVPAALGQAYLQKCGTIQDVREQGILAMKADQVFDAALNLDPENWEARFTKAVAMSYWPTQMNKGTEVMQHFVTLVDQQEAQAPQPQFAQTYLWLGNEYAKYGYTADAKAMWQRGAALFPNDNQLSAKLAQ